MDLHRPLQGSGCRQRMSKSHGPMSCSGQMMAGDDLSFYQLLASNNSPCSQYFDVRN